MPRRKSRALLIVALVATFACGVVAAFMFASAFPLCKVNVIELKPPVMLPI